MKAITAFLICSALARPVHAGQGTIVETDDAYIVEYNGDTAEKPADKAPPVRPAATQPSNPVAVPSPAPQPPAPLPFADGITSKQRAERVRDLSRKARSQGQTPAANNPENAE